MMSIRHSEVPIYLRDSDFYLSLNADDDGEISIPHSSCKLDDAVTDAASLIHLLSTLRFWGANYVPDGLYNAAIDSSHVFFDCTAKEFESELPFLPSLSKLRLTKPRQYVTAAIKCGSVELIKYLLCNGFKLSDRVTDLAAENGHLECLRYLHSIGCCLESTTCAAAARNGHFECLKYAHSHGCPWAERFMGHYAASSGNLLCLQYVAENNCPLECALYKKAASSDAIDCFRYLHSKGIPFPGDLVFYAAGVNGLKCLEFALQNGCVFTDNALTAAQSEECLHILYDSSHSWMAQSAALAAYSSIDKLRFLRERGCPWDESTYISALDNHSVTVNNTPNIECLVYAHQNRCPWSFRVSLHAVNVGNVPAIEYLLAHKCPFSAWHSATAAGFGNLKVLTILHEGGVPWDEETTTNAANNNSLKCLKYACAHGCPMADDICQQPANSGDAAIVNYLVSLGCRDYPLLKKTVFEELFLDEN